MVLTAGRRAAARLGRIGWLQNGAQGSCTRTSIASHRNFSAGVNLKNPTGDHHDPIRPHAAQTAFSSSSPHGAQHPGSSSSYQSFASSHPNDSSSSSSSSSSARDPDVEQLQQQLCAAALPFVQQLGWSQAALLAGAKQLQLSPAAIGVLPRQQANLVECLIQQHNAQLVEQLQQRQAEFAAMGTTQRVRTAVKLRLQMLGPWVNTWPQALSILAQPRNSLPALQLLANLVDDIWYHAAGDTSTDSSWYTKRALLAAVYTSTELYMLTDFTPNFTDTWAYLDRRLADVAALGKASRGVTTASQGLMEALSTLASNKLQFPSQSRPYV